MFSTCKTGYRSLSPAQASIWRSEVLHRHTSRWTQVTLVSLVGVVDPNRLEQAIQAVIKCNAALRTKVHVRQGQAFQSFESNEYFELVKHDDPMSASERPAAVAEFLREAVQDRFSLYDSPLFRADLLTFSCLDHLLVLRLHHLAADGIAIALIVSQIAASYRGEWLSLEAGLAYERWLDRGGGSVSQDGIHAALAFYAQELKGATRHHVSLYDQPGGKPSIDPPNLPEVTHTLDARICEALKTVARANGATLFIVIFAAFGAVLRTAVCSSDLVVATFVSGRSGEHEPIVGSCINTLLVRLRLDDLTTAADLIAAVKTGWRPVRRHQSAPLMLVSDAAGGSLPAAQFAINYLDMAEAPFELPGVVSTVTHAQQGFPLNDLLLYALREQDGQLRLRLIVGSGTARLSQIRIASLLDNLVRLLQSWVPDLKG